MKILVIRFSSIGDILMTTPVLRCIKQQMPEASLHFLTKRKFQFVLANNPHIDRFHYLEDSLQRVIGELKKEEVDYIVDLHHNLRTFLVKAALRKRSSAYFKANFEKWLIVKFKINRLPHTHTSERFLEAAAPLGIKDDGKGLDYFFQSDYSVDALLPATHRRNYAGFVIGGSYFTRRMPPEKIIAIISRLKEPVVLLGGPEDRDRGEMIRQAVGEQVFNACGACTFDQSAYLVKEADYIISHDTSLMHVAAAFNKKIISVWGHNLPEFGNFPFRVDQSFMLSVPGLDCRPCSKNGTDKCPRGHFKCMWNIDPDEVATLAEKTAEG